MINWLNYVKLSEDVLPVIVVIWPSFTQSSFVPVLSMSSLRAGYHLRGIPE